MKIRWLGLGSVLIISEKGGRIITDPFHPDENIPFSPITEQADIVTISHGHFAHSYVFDIKGNPCFRIWKGPGSVVMEGFRLKAVDSFHSGSRGNIRIILIDVDGIRVCHLGDLGYVLSDTQLRELGEIDLLLIPLHSSDVSMTLNDAAAVADRICRQIVPRLIIPLHHFVVDDLPSFVHGKENFVILDTNEVEFTKETVPTQTKILALKLPC